MVFIAIVFAILGSIVGSFLNVLVLRKGVASLGGRSHCPSCGKGIANYDLVPVLSWIYLGGRCRYCGSHISAQYPIVEAGSALLFAVVGSAFYPDFLLSLAGAAACLASLAIISLFIAITVYDFLHTIIPDEWSYTFAGLALLISFSHTPTWETLIAGPVSSLPLFFLWAVSRGRWMGLGDPKLALGIGWLLGLPLGVIAVFVSFILGSIVLVPFLLYQELVTHKGKGEARGEGLTMKSEVPFGPFLIASCLIFWVVGLYGVPVPLYILGL
jgi:prepilin signal peptidase PulO-like enzyme (type II secretory pathway)